MEKHKMGTRTKILIAVASTPLICLMLLLGFEIAGLVVKIYAPDSAFAHFVDGILNSIIRKLVGE